MIKSLRIFFCVSLISTAFFSNRATAQSFGFEELFFSTSNVDSIITEAADTLPNGSLTLVLAELSKFTYDAQCKQTRQADFFRDTARKSWVEYQRTNATYDASSRLTQSVFQAGLTNGSFVDTSRINYTYVGTSKNATKITRQIQFLGTTNWINEAEEDVTYTAANLPLTTIVKSWTGTAWLNEERSTNTYNAQNKLTASLGETWVNNAWRNDSRQTYRFNPQGIIDSITIESWDTVGKKWDVPSGIKFNVSQNGLTINTSFGIDAGFFELFFGLEFKARADKRLDTVKTFLLFPEQNASILSSRQRFTYNANCIRVSTQEAFYTEGVVKLAPNPATDNLTITLSELAEPNMRATIMSSTGQIVNTFKINDLTNQNIDISQLPNGLYFLNLEGKKVRTTQKFVVGR